MTCLAVSYCPGNGGNGMFTVPQQRYRRLRGGDVGARNCIELHGPTLFRRGHRPGYWSLRTSAGANARRSFGLGHAPGYGILALLLTCGLQRRAWPLAYALPVAAAAALVFGLWTEVFQGSVEGRESNVDDLMVDAIGIGLATMLMLSATVRNRIVLRSCLDSFLSFCRVDSLVSLDRPTKETIQTKQTR